MLSAGRSREGPRRIPDDDGHGANQDLSGGRPWGFHLWRHRRRVRAEQVRQADHCAAGEACGACGRECPAFFNLFLDGFDAAAWDVAVFDARGAAVPHGLYRTERGVVIGLQTVEGMFSGYRLAFAQKAGSRPGESRFGSRLEGSDRAYVPRSIADIIY